LQSINAPTVVISGEADPLIRWQGGRDTAARIPGARFVLYPGMGHAIPEELFGQVVEEVRRIASC
jgi:pimeloyl-ACP methyl ester carboxylesterase